MDQSFDSFGRIDRHRRNAIAFDEVWSELEGVKACSPMATGALMATAVITMPDCLCRCARMVAL